MPKLETTIDNLELKSNKIISTDDRSPDAWTDVEYPSAKTLLNIAHPVGSVLTTDSNKNPSEYLGGTWTLIDKAFRGKFVTYNDIGWESNNTTLHETSNALLIDHMIHLRIYVNTTVAISNDTDLVLGKLDLSVFGINEKNLSSATFRQPAISEKGDCTINYTINTDGTITINDVLSISGNHNAASGMDILFNVLLPVGYDRMIDSFCDKFYWKRTA
jgi:hypothetical protein